VSNVCFITCETFGEGMICWFSSEYSPQLNRSLGCMGGLGSSASLEGLQFLQKKLHYEGFVVLIQKKLHLSDNDFC